MTTLQGFYELHDSAKKTVGVFYDRDELVRALNGIEVSLFTKVFFVPMSLAWDGTSAQGIIRVTGSPREVPINELLSTKEGA